MSKDKKEKNKETEEQEATSEEMEEPDATETEAEEAPTLEAESTEEEITEDITEDTTEEVEELSAETIEEEIDEEPEEAKAEEQVEEVEATSEEEPEDLTELEIPEEPIEIIAEDDTFSPEIPDVPIEIKSDDLEVDDEAELAPDKDEDIEDIEFEVEEVKPEKVKKPKKKRTHFGLSLLIGLVVALAIEVLFSIPLWLQGSSRPDLYYIELVLILIALMIPGLITRSIQRGILGAFIIFVASFTIPTVLAIFEFQTISNPLAPLFASTDFALPTLDVFIGLFPDLADLPFEQIQKWIWIVDLVIMFILTVIVVLFATWLIRNITKRKKKAGNWIAIPFLSIGLIVFAIFTPIIFSSTTGVIQAGTSFLAGATKMQDAYGVFEGSGLELDLDAFNLIKENITEANYWLNISAANYNGLRNIGFITIASMVAGQYGPLIQAGDQLALATLAMTDVLLPLFSGIYGLTQSLKNATDDMADFGQESPFEPSDIGPILLTTQAITDIDELKESIVTAIAAMEAARDDLLLVNATIGEADISDVFDDVQSTLEDLIAEGNFPDAVMDIITEIHEKLGTIDSQLVGFTDFIEFTAVNINPTIHILWTAYNSIEGNAYMKNYSYANAMESFDQAISNLTEALTFEAYTPPGEIGAIFSVDMTDDFSELLEDLLLMLDPILKEEYAYASTYEAIWNIVDHMNTNPLNQEVTYTTIAPDLLAANQSAVFTFDNGTLAQTLLDDFRDKTALGDYGPFADVASSFDNLLTNDFKPYLFGEITLDISVVYSGFVESMRQYYYLSDVPEAISYIGIADTTMDIIVGKVPAELVFAVEYFDSWKVAMLNIRAVVEGAPDDIAVRISDLFVAIDEK
ncbi:MAG: hypothetical protein FK733_10690 [Asgard group archaeon]|nr:hypothetical protein [Asgard group archaeon]